MLFDAVRVSSRRFRQDNVVVRLDFHPQFTSSLRWVSSQRNQDDIYKLEGLPFTISPEQATAKFYGWVFQEQGLKYILRSNSVRLSAAFCPVWSFDLNVRYVTTDSGGRRDFKWKPDLFRRAYGEQPIIHMPGLSSYAGYNYRRSLLNPLHNISLLFLGSQTVPFSRWMLRDMKLSNGQFLGITPDAWNSPKGRALTVAKEELLALAEQSNDFKIEVQTEVVSSRRVYMPTYVFEYSVLGEQYMAFVSGCDAGAQVSGDSHKIFGQEDLLETSRNFLNNALGSAKTAARVLGPRGVAVGMQLLLSIVGRFLIRLPLFASVSLLIIGFKKIVQPFYKKQFATAAWERQREHEAMMKDFQVKDNFVDNGAARRYFDRNRERILSQLSGSASHERGDFDCYMSWESWAREQYQRQQSENNGQSKFGQDGHAQKVKSRRHQVYHWEFDPDDPYSVLGIRRDATKEEIGAAYRKQMLSNHPDVQTGKSEAEKERAEERTKLINEAYRKLKLKMKY